MFRSVLVRQSVCNVVPKTLVAPLCGAQLIHTSSLLSLHQTGIVNKKSEAKGGPKRPIPSFMLFVKSIRGNLTQEYPHYKPTEIAKLCGERWRALSEYEKRPFVEEYEKALEDYKIEKLAFEKTLPPKRPGGPFIQYANEVRSSVDEKYSELSLVERTKKIGEGWRSLSEYERQQYTDKYEALMNEWKLKMQNSS
ncbi:hypothetical protein Kpol_1018p32 [Vanderwaltozyma polyspora DSM 70294]|uniref:HMG box domain-containing protein n=1 Tax=Vanderwaltozyma polyspora (strain ATCC 22028 / DSM 70294 / BCRC 21397 / CBS 2163 / NBRC 10782 / NRRL Y-8283 / UCD 57-17) TaxID=436907 RepID=A7TDN3_VANPO|nr:uncharacterized protein Kpol_1018p32 [Vanderwaltozyma polyspora DSM 70294]EDO19503.1 hypothetical protein Kpol_1018p32 [Vanderwaltozyma polyspora DSM 70294]